MNQISLLLEMFQGPSQKLLKEFENVRRRGGWVQDLHYPTITRKPNISFRVLGMQVAFQRQYNECDFFKRAKLKILETGVSTSTAEISVVRVLIPWGAPLT